MSRSKSLTKRSSTTTPSWRVLGDQFLVEVLACLERLKQFPEAGHPFTPNSRRWRTRRFPYGIAYQILESEILIVALAHLHRRPGYWLNRISKLAEQ